jgi:hypothetical protein
VHKTCRVERGVCRRPSAIDAQSECLDAGAGDGAFRGVLAWGTRAEVRLWMTRAVLGKAKLSYWTSGDWLQQINSGRQERLPTCSYLPLDEQ